MYLIIFLQENMAIVIEYNPKEFIKEINKYEKKRLRFVSYRTIEFLGEKVVQDVNKKYKKPFFKDPVPLTLNSTFAKNYKIKQKLIFFQKMTKHYLQILQGIIYIQ
tara:strand:- start:545 stop:862 length:318 start_codon:yes stop_codon:yes gene_type:complete